MKVRMKQKISGTRDGSPWPEVGDTIVVGDQEGADLCASGCAEPVASPAKSEKRAAKKSTAKK